MAALAVGLGPTPPVAGAVVAVVLAGATVVALALGATEGVAGVRFAGTGVGATDGGAEHAATISPTPAIPEIRTNARRDRRDARPTRTAVASRRALILQPPYIRLAAS
jgi:hypothetical protein